MTPLGGSNTTAAALHRDSGGTDEFGTQTKVLTVLYVGPAIYAPGNSVESTNGGDTVVTQPTVYLPTGTDVTAIDVMIPEVVVGEDGDPVLDGDGIPTGRRYDIDGDPTAWPANPFSGTVFDFSVEVKLKGQTG